MQGLVDELAELSIGLDGHENLGSLERDLEVLEVVALQDLDVTQGGFDQGIRVGLAVFFLQIAFQRARVNTNADGDAVVLGAGDDLRHLLVVADVAGGDAQAVRASFGSGEAALVVEVDVRDQRHVTHFLLDLTKSLGGGEGRHRDAHDVRTRLHRRADLGHGGGHVLGVGVGHGLHRDGGGAADGDAPHTNSARKAPRNRVLGLHGHVGCSKTLDRLLLGAQRNVIKYIN